MSHLMIGNDAALLLRKDAVLLLLTHQNHLNRLEEILLGNLGAAVLYGSNGGLVHHVGEVGTHGTAGGQRNFIEVHGIIQKDVLGMHLQDLHTALEIRLFHHHAAVKAARTQQRGIQDLRPVGGAHDHDALSGIEAVHFGQELVQGLLALVIAAHAGVSGLSDGIDFIDKDDAGCGLSRLLEEVADTAGTYAHKHFHKVRTGQGIKGHLGLTGHGLRQQSFSGSRRAHQQGTLRQLRTDGGVLDGIVKEVHNLLEAFLRLVLASHILEADAGFLLHVHLRSGLADAHEAVAAAHPLHHHVHHDEKQHEGKHKADQGLHDVAGVVRLPLVDLHPVLIEPLHELCRVCIDGHHIIALLTFAEELLIALLILLVQEFLQELLGLGICPLPALRSRNLNAILGIYRDLVVAPLHLLHLVVVHHGEKGRIAQLLAGAGNKKLPHHRINKKGDNGCNDQEQKGLSRIFESAVVAAAIVVVVHSILLAL